MTGKQAFDRANPNTVPDLLRRVEAGTIVQSGLPIYKYKYNPDVTGALNPDQLATVDTLDCGDAPAAVVLRATARAGGVTGELTPAAFGATPTTGQIAVAPNGDVVFLATDAITDVDVIYIPMKCKVVELVLGVIAATGVMALPLGLRTAGILAVLEAEALEGTVTGRKRILVPGAVNPATPQARLSVAKDQLQFTVADAITRARVRLAVAPDVDLDSWLKGSEGGIT